MFNSNGKDVLSTYFTFPIPEKHMLLDELKYNAAIDIRPAKKYKGKTSGYFA